MSDYDPATLWIGDPVDVDDDTWRAIRYEDGSVQFVHREDKTQIWQDRVVVSEQAGGGRAEAHYVETEDVVLLALARNNRTPPEKGLVLEAARVADDWEALTRDEQETVLKILLVEWTNIVAKPIQFQIAQRDVTDAVRDAAAETGRRPTDTTASVSEVLRFGLDAVDAGEERYA